MSLRCSVEVYCLLNRTARAACVSYLLRLLKSGFHPKVYASLIGDLFVSCVCVLALMGTQQSIFRVTPPIYQGVLGKTSLPSPTNYFENLRITKKYQKLFINQSSLLSIMYLIFVSKAFQPPHTPRSTHRVNTRLYVL